ncbi:hypothetical protein H6F60_25200 [Coleofasciculus sp. FACHB-129]|nr:hypothetical protein [Coleofasciculus sp. FACHB-129]
MREVSFFYVSLDNIDFTDATSRETNLWECAI